MSTQDAVMVYKTSMFQVCRKWLDSISNFD